MPPAARATASWETVEPAPVVLVQGAEAILAERAVDRVVARAREADPAVEVTRIDAAAYAAGQLRVLASPSLFEDPRVVVLDDLAQGTDAAMADVVEYLADPAPDTVVVLRHGGGVRGKKTLDAVRASGAVVVTCDVIKRDADKQAFAAAEFTRAGRRIDAAGLRALVEACGAELRELASACQQLIADTTGRITAADVERYHAGRVEATGFQVADAAVAGDAGRAVALLRHAIATGSDPVPIVAALAAKLRLLAKVGATRGRGTDPVRDLGLPSWQVDRARRDLAGWTPESLARAITAVARADAEVKGAGRDPVFAVERAVLTVAAGRSARLP